VLLQKQDHNKEMDVSSLTPQQRLQYAKCKCMAQRGITTPLQKMIKKIAPTEQHQLVDDILSMQRLRGRHQKLEALDNIIDRLSELPPDQVKSMLHDIPHGQFIIDLLKQKHPQNFPLTTTTSPKRKKKKKRKKRGTKNNLFNLPAPRDGRDALEFMQLPAHLF
jgi:hypothetical protein